MLEYQHQAYKASIKKQIIDMAINGSGIRDTTQVLGINKNTVISTLKKESRLVSVNLKFKRAKVSLI